MHYKGRHHVPRRGAFGPYQARPESAAEFLDHTTAQVLENWTAGLLYHLSSLRLQDHPPAAWAAPAQSWKHGPLSPASNVGVPWLVIRPPVFVAHFIRPFQERLRYPPPTWILVCHAKQ